MIRIIAIALLASATVASAVAADEAAASLWTSKVQPLLQERCFTCHGPTKQKHGLRLDSLEAILKGGKDYGPAIVAGKPDESPLIKVCTMPRDDEMAMPPQGKGDPLSAEEIGWLKAWIAAGAQVP
jgi:mono/diheme cytochrome c family protein